MRSIDLFDSQILIFFSYDKQNENSLRSSWSTSLGVQKQKSNILDVSVHMH